MVAHRTATLIMRQIVLKLAQTRDLGMSSRPAIPDCYQKFVLSYMIAHMGRSTLTLPPSRWQLKIAKNVVGRAYTINIEGAQRYQQQLFLIDRTTNPTIRPPFGCRRRARPDDEEVLGQTTLSRMCTYRTYPFTRVLVTPLFPDAGEETPATIRKSPTGVQRACSL